MPLAASGFRCWPRWPRLLVILGVSVFLICPQSRSRLWTFDSLNIHRRTLTEQSGIFRCSFMKPALLIVEDEKTSREGLRAALEDRYDVYVTEDAASAMQLLET